MAQFRGIRSKSAIELQELTQVLLERTGGRERALDLVPASELADLDALLEELDFVNSCSESMAIHDRH